MNDGNGRNHRLALAIAAAIGAATVASVPSVAEAAKVPGKYVTGDFHNHTTCSDGSISMQKLVNKATVQWGLDWFVQAGHGGNGNRNCTLVEDATLATPVYPFLSGNTPINTGTAAAPSQFNGPQTTWAQTIGTANVKGSAAGTVNMWRWQSIQEYQYPLMEYLSALKTVPLFIGMESVVAGHEHTSMSVITGQMPVGIDAGPQQTSPSASLLAPQYAALGNANALAQWSYCFDRGDTDTSRGNTTLTSGVGNNWDCSVTGSLNAADPSWNAAGFKLLPAAGAGVGTKGHLKTVEGLKWMVQNHPNGSYYVPAHLERAGQFYADGNQGFNVEHLRDFNNVAPGVAFGMESQPGHGASANRGEYQVKRNNINGVLTDSVGGTAYGGTGVYGAVVGAVWDALLGEGRNFWFFASSDWHNRGIFGADDRRSTQDFQPGEYQADHVMVRNGTDKLRPQSIVDGLRTGNSYTTSGQLIDRLAFVACASYPGLGAKSNAFVENLALNAASNNTDIDATGCATMGEKLKARPGAEIVVSVVVRDPSGPNNSPYSFANPSLTQIGVTQPLNMPVLDHIDLIRGLVTSTPKVQGSADYAGAWPANTAWLAADGSIPADLSGVPAAAKNTSAAVLRVFSSAGAGATGSAWTPVVAGDGTTYLKMTYRIAAVTASQYVRLRGTNLPPAVNFETDGNGNPLPDVFTNANDTTMLRIPCTVTGTNVPANAVTWTQASGLIDGCPTHLATATAPSPIAGQKAVSFDVAAWADLWFYANPIFVEVANSVVVAGVK